MAKEIEGADYGESTPEEHRKSGYRYPGTFYEPPTPQEKSTPETVEADRKRASKVEEKPAPSENKAVTPATETKTTAKKSGRKSSK